MIDYNAYVGEWPFYKLPRTTLGELIELHRKNGISGGYVSSLHSIFYNDFYESESELAEILSGSGYHHVVTVNPSFPECALTLLRCIREFDVRGVRIHPGYHGYALRSEVMAELLEILREYRLPLFINARVHDERLTHILHPTPPDIEAVRSFVKENSDIKIVLCHFRCDEVLSLSKELFELENLYAETSAFRFNLFENDLTELLPYMLYGSDYPIYPVTSSALLFKTEIEDEKIRKAFLEREDVLAK